MGNEPTKRKVFGAPLTESRERVIHQRVLKDAQNKKKTVLIRLGDVKANLDGICKEACEDLVGMLPADRKTVILEDYGGRDCFFKNAKMTIVKVLVAKDNPIRPVQPEPEAPGGNVAYRSTTGHLRPAAFRAFCCFGLWHSLTGMKNLSVGGLTQDKKARWSVRIEFT